MARKIISPNESAVMSAVMQQDIQKAVAKIAKKNGAVYRTYEDYDYETLLCYAGLDCIATSELLVNMMPEIARTLPIRTPEGLTIQAPAIIEVAEKGNASI
jgi:hypothetical protein